MGERIVRRLLRFSYRHRARVLMAAAVVVVACVPLLLSARFDSNVLNLLPREGAAIDAFKAYLGRFGNFDRLYILFEAPPDRPIADASDLIDAYVDELAKAPEIARVDTDRFASDKDWTYVLNRELLLLGDEERREALARFDPSAMDIQLARARDALSMPSSDVKAMVQNDPLGLLPMLRDHLSGEGGQLAIDPRQSGYVSQDGRSRLVMAEPVRPPFDTAFSRQLLTRLDEIAVRARTRAAGEARERGEELPDITIQTVGAYRVAPETQSVIVRESVFNAAGSLACILLLVFIVFRSLRVLVVASVPIVVAVLVTMAVNGIFFDLSTAGSGAAAILFGLAIDGVLLIYVRYLQELRLDLDGEEAVGRVAGAGVSMMLGYFTTAATFFGLLAIDFPTLQELGRLIGVGILVCGVATLVLAPALLPKGRKSGGGKTEGKGQLSGALTAPWIPRLVRRWRRPILVGATLATVVLGIASRDLRIIPTLERLEPHTSEMDRERDLARRFGLPEEVALVVSRGADLEPALMAQQRLLERLDGAGIAARSPVSLLPAAAAQERAAQEVTKAGLQPAVVSASLADASARAGFRPDTFQPFLDRLPQLLDPSARLTFEGFERHGLRDALDRFVSIEPGNVMTVAYVYPRTPGELQQIEEAVKAVGPPLVLTGALVVNHELDARFMPQFLKGVVIGTVGVIALTLAAFRSVRMTLLALLPTVLGLIWALGLLAIFGIELDLFSVFALLMCIGIGVDYGIHVLYRYATDQSGLDLDEALTTVGPAILLALATTAIGFGTVGTSSYAPLRSLGIASAVMATASLIGALLVLPAIVMRGKDVA
jgi:uncharacterized protein